MNRASALSGSAVTLLLAGIAAAQTDRPSGVDPARWVPADALVYVGFTDLARFSEDFQRTALHRMMQHPIAPESRGPLPALLRRSYEQFKTRLARALDVEPDALRNPLGGPLAVYVAPAPGDRNAGLKAVVVAGISDATLLRDYYDRATRRFSQIARQHEQIRFGAYTLDHFTSPARPDGEKRVHEGPSAIRFDELTAEPESFGGALDTLFGGLFSAESMPAELVLCQTEDRLIVAPTVEHAKRALQPRPDGDSLADTEPYRALREAFHALGSVRFVLNAQRLFEIMEATQDDEVRKALAVLGLKSAQGLVGQVSCGTPQFDWKLEAVLLLSSERTGLANILSMKNGPMVPPAFAPADSLLYARLNVDVAALLDEVERMVRRGDPTAADELRGDLESFTLPDGSALNVRQELLGHLCEPLTLALGFQRPPGPSARILLTLGHHDRAAVARFFEKLAGALPGTLIERDTRGTPAYDLPLLGVSIATADDALLVGTADAVDAALQAPTPAQSLAGDPRFQHAVALAPGQASAVVYVDARRLLEAALALSEHEDALEFASVGGAPNLLLLQVAEAFTVAGQRPPRDTLRQLSGHLAPRIITLATTLEGVRFTQIDLAPKDD
jgi:hypothetical protein